jgi:hypothetical protein
MAVRGGEAERITAPILPTSGRSGAAVTIYFRVHEGSGIATLEPVPEISVESGDGAVDSLQPSELYPNTWWLRYRLGTTPGANRFRIGAGAASRTVTITGVL